MMIVHVDWTTIQENSDLWNISRGLYAYSTVDLQEVLYIGKVDGTTIRQRWSRTGKAAFWDDLEKERKIRQHVVFAGDIDLPTGTRLSMELLADIESLLIKRIAPWGNIQSRDSRISRPGLRVRCRGEWPLRKREFLDIG